MRDDAWTETERHIRAMYKDPTPEQLREMPALKTVDERVANAKRYHDWHLREFGRAPRVGGGLGA